MGAAARFDTFDEVGFSRVRRVVHHVDARTVERYRVERGEYADILHVYGFRFGHAVAVDRQVEVRSRMWLSALPRRAARH